MLDSIGQIAVITRDLPRAVAYYRDVLGIPFLFEAPPALAFFKCGDMQLMLSPPESKEFEHASSILYFNTVDIDATHSTLRSRGVKFRDEPHRIHSAGGRELWMTFFEDSEGNVLAIQQWKSVRE